MTKLQLSAIGLSVVLSLALYLGCETVPGKFQNLEKSRSFAIERTDIQVLLQEAKAKYTPAQMMAFSALEQELSRADSDSSRMGVLKKLSGKWFSLEEYAIAGFYAQEVAEILQDGDSWEIAGATYAIGLQRSPEETVKNYCTSRAIQAFENAISLNPSELSHRINLALVYADRPLEDNPMKGIQMLLELDRNNPDHPAVLFHLGRLALRTGQYDRAVERLQKVSILDPERREAFCLLAQAYQELGREAEASAARERCEEKTL